MRRPQTAPTHGLPGHVSSDEEGRSAGLVVTNNGMSSGLRRLPISVVVGLMEAAA